MRSETKTFTNSKTNQSKDYTLQVPESLEDVLAAFKGNLADYEEPNTAGDGVVKRQGLLSWATANLPDNRNEYQKARLATEPPVKTLASAAIKLIDTGLEQFKNPENAVAAVCIASQHLSDDVLKAVKARLAKA